MNGQGGGVFGSTNIAKLHGVAKDGSPCKKCGNTARYVKSRECVACKARKVSARKFKDERELIDVERRRRVQQAKDDRDLQSAYDLDGLDV